MMPHGTRRLHQIERAKSSTEVRRAGQQMATTDDIRRWAMALPEVEETSHFRFHVPIWKVRGKTFLGMTKDETAAVFRVSEQEADEAASADPATYAAIRRQDTRRSFLGLQADLSQVSPERVRDLAEKAWRCQAPKALAAGPGRGSSAPRRGLFLAGGTRAPGRG